MIQSAKPRSQRLFRFTAPLHQRQHFVNAHVDKSLRTKLGIKRRAIRLATGDTVKIMSGSKRGTTGKVTAVDLGKGRIKVSSLVKKNAKGKEFSVSISPSNVYITDLNLEDKFRAERLRLAQAPKAKAEQKQAAAAPATAPAMPAPKVEAKQEAQK
ncbi:MAG: 50S ribosomal protein L24 [Candidatus Micrarchaeota archaeon]|nr:50S ribosomal protein L24 [Candidatus Micrarchaeota archaeon]